MSAALLIMLILFLILAIMGLPLAFVIGVSSISYFVINGSSLNTVVHTFFYGINSIVILAIPLFILAGDIMYECKIMDGVINFANLLVGKIRGGLAHVTILASMFFAGCTGSALSDVAAIGSVLVPAMKKNGYSQDFGAAVTVAASLQGPIIPPSIPIVVLASATQLSTGALLVGGAVPGIFLGLVEMVLVWMIAKKRNYGFVNIKYKWNDVVRICKESIPALVMPVILMGGILGGFFTPTEAAAVAVGYSIILGVFYYKNLTLKSFLKICGDVAIGSASIFMLIGTAGTFGWILANENVPQMLVTAITHLTTNPYTILFIINISLLIWGMFMDAAPAILLFTPILLPLITKVGINPIHFGIVTVFNLMIGLATPPYGLALFSATAVCDSTIESITKELLPFLTVAVVVLALITYIPQITIWLPSVCGLMK
jgi:tripartite ATP-independent transporter DctM subunit